ncbi:MAG TPA: sugar ABC transporter substrate-binding protein [Candidatus Dormibacteraeota bacterium]|nr:sugar ABC transporter substrate-binding protein [Candidatus Dormibacteraeota bacterium]
MSDIKLRPSDRRRATSKPAFTVVLGLLVALVGAACSGAGGGGGGGSSTTITLAAVDNPSMADLKKLVGDFQSSHSNITVKIVTLPEDQLRQQVTQDVAANSGRYDLFTIGTYEVPLWAKKGWIENLSPYIAKDSSYAPDDLIPGIKGALSYNSNLYAVPFYGESSMLMYRKDMLSAAGVTMPDHPTWDQVAAAAQKVNSSTVNGICLRGLPGWGEQLAPLDTVVNTFGGRWFDQSWNAQLNTPQWKSAVTFYVNLLKSAGEPGAGNAGFTECLNAYNSGKVAMWYDATVAASFFTGDAAKNSGYAYAPTKVKDWSGWLWAWSLGMPSSSKKKDAAWTFADWATNKDYAKLVGTKLGWARVSPGTRTSTYAIPEYQQAAGAFAQVTLDSIAHADVTHPTVDPVPYIGVQYVDIDEFQQLGDQVSQEFAKVIAGGQTVDQALAKAQALATTVGKVYQH